MAKIIVLGHTKGGVGKSVLSLNIADYIASCELKVALIDADPQRSNTKLREQFGKSGDFGFEVIDLSTKAETLDAELSRLDGVYDYLVVDCPPAKDVGAMKQALKVADLLIIPFKPYPMDFLEFTEMEPLVKVAQKVNPKLKHVGVATQVPSRLTKLNQEVIEGARDTEVMVLKGMIHQREIYPVATAEARGVCSMKLKSKSDKTAMAEIEALSDEIIELLS